ncbi:ABC-2 type transporter [Neobacillus bataviensis LMG 21833]|uniref:ABC-2 type transporter n=1 Tax=Neobacillus bataviensis LMG 21833 TaxID=1117379 RepID=K6DTX0_9BACI|nr:ABC transporter permease [Neobacillus bataviensis]EKN71708.1 ABC-2 type transporter [Neobacillus bataviensis LMG 21833]
MKLLSIAYYTFIRNIRDIKAMLAFILLPILMILILGKALDSAYTPKKLDPMNVGYFSKDAGVLNSSMNEFFTAKETRSIIEVKKVKSLESGKNQVKSGKLKGLIYLSKGTSDQFKNGEQVTINFYSKEKNSFVQPVLESFVRTFNIGNTLIKLNGQQLQPNSKHSILKEVKLVTKGKIPRGIDYYSLTALFQSMLFGAIFGVFAITKDMGNHTNIRMIAAPIKTSKIILGKLLGSSLTLYSISLLIFLVSKFVFKGNWDGSLWLILLVLFMFSTISVAFGMILAHLSKSTMASSLSIFIIGTVLTLVAGGFSRMDGKVIETLSYLSPNTYAQKTLFTNIYEGTFSRSNILSLVFYTIIVITLTFITGRRRVA